MFEDIFNTLWDTKTDLFLLRDKRRRTLDHVSYMLDRTQQIFIWEHLPDTIPAHNLETLIQTHGNGCITEVKEVPEGRGKPGLYAFFGGLGGIQNAYYEPTIYTVSNPYLEFTAELEIGRDCVRIRNDKNGIGLLPMFVKYGAMLNENEISLNMLAITYRIANLISADNDRTYESAKQFLNDVVAGKFGVIASEEFFDGIRNDKTNGSENRITDLIEYEQYLKSCWYNEIGLNSNYNMKRERISSAETQLNNDALIPLVDNMLEWRQNAIEDIKNLYADKYPVENITVKLNPLWDLDRQYVAFMPEQEPENPEELEEPDTMEEPDTTEEQEQSENDTISDTDDDIDRPADSDNTENVEVKISIDVNEGQEQEPEEQEQENEGGEEDDKEETL